jgi:hypothetical protein
MRRTFVIAGVVLIVVAALVYLGRTFDLVAMLKHMHGR